MNCYKFSEEELFSYAFHHASNVEILDVLIREFGLDVNWRGERFYDTLLYQALKSSDLSAAEFLISKGACINCSLGGYPRSPEDHGPMSLVDVVGGFYSLRNVGGADWLKKQGAVSFERLPETNKDKVIASVDRTKQARDDVYVYRTKDQVDLILSMAPEMVREELSLFATSGKLVEVDVNKPFNR